MPTPWARPLNIYKRCSVVSCHVTCVFYETSKIRNNQAENVFFFRREKQEGPNLWNVVDEWSQKYFEPGRSNSAFFRGHVDPSYLHLIYLFELGNVLRRFSPKHRGWHTQREWWRRKISLKAFDTGHICRHLHSPSICCGFQVIDTAVACILSRVGPTIRRGHRLISYCTIVVVCIPRLLAVVVSVKAYATLPVLCMSDDKINTAVLVYDK